MTALPKGVSKWTPEELKTKENFEAAAPRSLLSVLKTNVPDEFQLVDLDVARESSQVAFITDAINHILALLNFPNKSRAFLDCLIGMTGDAGTESFTATNFEVARRARSGNGNCSDDSMTKWTSREKQKLQDWQAFKNFELVKIVNGTYDPIQEKNLPTSYTCYIHEFALKTVYIAQSKGYWKKGAKYRKFQGRALREAAREVLYSLPECPPLAMRKIKTLSEEDKFDRRHKSVLTFLEKNRDACSRLGVAHEEYFYFIATELDKICFNKPGLLGMLLNAEKDMPVRDLSVWRMLKSGELTDLIQKYREENTVEIVLPLQAQGSVEAAAVKHADNAFDGGTYGDLLNNSETAKSLETKSDDGGTYSSPGQVSDENVKHSDGGTNLDLEDAFAHVEITVEAIDGILSEWSLAIREKVPDAPPSQIKTGVWQIYWGEQFDSRSKAAQTALDGAIFDIAHNARPLADIKPLFVDWIMCRADYYKDLTRIAVADSTVNAFRARLEKFLKLPGELNE